MIEEWKEAEILGLKYKVSNTGKIVGLGRNRELKQRYTRDGYLEVTIGNLNTGRTSRRVHRLVAQLFIPNPNNLEEINHKDYNRANNNVENLEWCTHIQNIRYSICNKPDVNGKNNPNYGNHKLSKIYSENPEYALEKQSRKGAKNGRCIKVKMYDIKLNEHYNFNFIGECADFLKTEYGLNCEIDSLRWRIRTHMKNGTIYKSRFKFKEII